MCHYSVPTAAVLLLTCSVPTRFELSIRYFLYSTHDRRTTFESQLNATGNLTKSHQRAEDRRFFNAIQVIVFTTANGNRSRDLSFISIVFLASDRWPDRPYLPINKRASQAEHVVHDVPHVRPFVRVENVSSRSHELNIILMVICIIIVVVVEMPLRYNC